MYWGFFLVLACAPFILLVGAIHSLIQLIYTPKNVKKVQSTANKIGGSIYDLTRITAYAVVPIGCYMLSNWISYPKILEVIDDKYVKMYGFFLIGIFILSAYQSLLFFKGRKSYYSERTDYFCYLVLIPFFLPVIGSIFLRLAFWIINLF